MSMLDLFRRRSIKAGDTAAMDECRRRIETLTPRERETFELLVEGYTLRYCAEQLGVKYPTVNTYSTAIYRKLGVSRRTELIIRYRNV